MQTLRPFPRHTKSESPGVRPCNLFKRDLQVVLVEAHAWEPLVEIVVERLSNGISGRRSSKTAAGQRLWPAAAHCRLPRHTGPLTREGRKSPGPPHREASAPAPGLTTH